MYLALTSTIPVLGLNFFSSSWPWFWPQRLCPRLYLCKTLQLHENVIVADCILQKTLFRLRKLWRHVPLIPILKTGNKKKKKIKGRKFTILCMQIHRKKLYCNLNSFVIFALCVVKFGQAWRFIQLISERSLELYFVSQHLRVFHRRFLELWLSFPWAVIILLAAGWLFIFLSQAANLCYAMFFWCFYVS